MQSHVRKSSAKPDEVRANIAPKAAALLLVIALGLVSGWPILGPALPRADDSIYHLYRSVQLGELIRSGVLFSRWAPDLVWGYGYPLFNYYAPLAYYLIQLTSLATSGYVTGINLSMMLILALGAVAMYLWVSDNYGTVSGIVSSAAFVFSPYLVANASYRYVPPELLALALLPLTFLCLGRLARMPRLLYLVCGAFSYAGVILAHQGTALLSAPFVAVWALALAVRESRGAPFARVLFRLSLPLLLALALSVWYWGPALAEARLAQMDRLTMWTVFDYRESFVRLDQLLALPQPVGRHLLNVDFRAAVSANLIPLVFVALSALGLRGLQRSRGLWLVLLLALAVALFWALDLSAPLWGRIRFLGLMQFPWRFLGIAAVFQAALVGAGAHILDERLAKVSGMSWLRALALALLVACLVGPLAPQVRPGQRLSELNPVTIASVRAHGRADGNIGTTTSGEYLPVTARVLPDPMPVSEERTARLVRSSLPSNAALHRISYTALRESVVVETTTPFDAVFRTFYFPGWYAELNGEPADIRPTNPHGLISVAVPEGRHALTVAFGSSPIRRVCEAVSLVGLLAVVALCAAARARPRARPSYADTAGACLSVAQIVFIAALSAGAVLLARLPARAPTLGWAAGTAGPMVAEFGGGLTLLSFDALPSPPAGETAAISLYWQLAASSDQRYSVSVQVLDAAGYLVAQSDNLHPGSVPTDEWPAGPYYVHDAHAIRIPYGTPVGPYAVQVVVYEYGDPLAVQPVRDADGDKLGHTLPLGQIAVRAGGPLPLEATGGARFGDQVALLGYSGPAPTHSGEKATLRLYWRADTPPARPLSASVRLLDGDGRTVMQQDHVDIAGLPTSSWAPDRVYEETFGLGLPFGLPPGDYALRLLVYERGLPANTLEAHGTDGAPLGDVLDLGSLKVLGPFRNPRIEELALSAPVEQALYPGLVYLGSRAVSQSVQVGHALDLVTFWQATARMRRDLTVTLRLRDAAGRAVMETTAPPVPEWPTSGWRRGEVWRGVHHLAIPGYLESGVYRIEVEGDPSAGAAALATLHVDAPTRNYVMPATLYAAHASLGDLATLVGYSLPVEVPAGDALQVDLVWLAQATAEKSYKSFVHVLDAHGRLVTGSDAVPSDWLRPTTGWATGEYVEDTHLISLPADMLTGEYTIVVGLYDQDSLQRLTTADGDDAIRLTPLLCVVDAG